MATKFIFFLQSIILIAKLSLFRLFLGPFFQITLLINSVMQFSIFNPDSYSKEIWWFFICKAFLTIIIGLVRIVLSISNSLSLERNNSMSEKLKYNHSFFSKLISTNNSGHTERLVKRLISHPWFYSRTFP